MKLDFSLELRSSGQLSSEEWQNVTDDLGQPIGGTDGGFLEMSVRNYHYSLRNTHKRAVLISSPRKPEITP